MSGFPIFCVSARRAKFPTVCLQRQQATAFDGRHIGIRHGLPFFCMAALPMSNSQSLSPIWLDFRQQPSLYQYPTTISVIARPRSNVQKHPSASKPAISSSKSTSKLASSFTYQRFGFKYTRHDPPLRQLHVPTMKLTFSNATPMAQSPMVYKLRKWVGPLTLIMQLRQVSTLLQSQKDSTQMWLRNSCDHTQLDDRMVPALPYRASLKTHLRSKDLAPSQAHCSDSVASRHATGQHKREKTGKWRLP